MRACASEVRPQNNKQCLIILAMRSCSYCPFQKGTIECSTVQFALSGLVILIVVINKFLHRWEPANVLHFFRSWHNKTLPLHARWEVGQLSWHHETVLSWSKSPPWSYTKAILHVGCHRYDQSAPNLILARKFGLDYFSRSTNVNVSNSIWSVRRKR